MPLHRLPCVILVTLLLQPPGTVLAEKPLSAARQAELETLLYQDCGSCHGMTLRGGLGPALPASRMNAYSRDSLASLILNGVAGTAMPGWAGLLSEQDARWLADHLQHDNPLKE
ncbi:c-type cytochrome [Halomonas cerina]|uniref:Cytochrome c55X n=1 Tax=Halomonas cerina TaxID=447424 RepID=A0A839V3S7_9GAMM|nr:cytochrome c [Halomonas cerina]MBB3190353.1 cytochrome c55X [Halomonas cerina]